HIDVDERAGLAVEANDLAFVVGAVVIAHVEIAVGTEGDAARFGEVMAFRKLVDQLPGDDVVATDRAGARAVQVSVRTEGDVVKRSVADDVLPDAGRGAERSAKPHDRVAGSEETGNVEIAV